MVDFKVQYRGNCASPWGGGQNMFSWLANINGQEFEYFTGSGHSVSFNPEYNFGPNKKRGVSQRKALFEAKKQGQYIREGYSYVFVPCLDSILNCLFMDGSACDESFDDWCGNFGYETDSRKALETYLKCQENASKLKKALGNEYQTEKQRIEELEL